MTQALIEQCGPLRVKVEAAVAAEEAEAERAELAWKAIAAADEAEREVLREAERQRQRRRVRLCVFCGRHGCGFMPRDFIIEEGGMRQVVPLGRGGSIVL